MTDEIKALHELITNVRLDLRELNVKMDGIKDLTKKVEEIQSVASEALQSTKAAHKRLDVWEPKIEGFNKHYDDEIKAANARIEAESKGILAIIDKDNERKKQDRRWLIGTLIAVAGLLATNITLILRMVGK